MRLRLTVRRHRLPDTLVIWAIDTTSNPTVYHLLEQVNDTIPIESDGQWGLDDYAVEVKGSTGANYECLHFQHLASVIKDEDEVIIRPLLSQDIKIRRVSGRVQISTDGRHLVDGVPWGRPLLRKAGDRPAVNIPPRKRQRIEYNEDDGDTEGYKALKEKEADDEEPENNRQLVLHADFEDDDEEDDDDFAPGENEDADEEEGSEEDLEGNIEEGELEEEGEPPIDSTPNDGAADNANEPALADIEDQVTRAQIRVNENKLSVLKTGSKSKTPSVHEPEIVDSMQVEPAENALIDYYDQNGLPPGSNRSGKALSVMAEALKSSSIRPLAEPRRSASVTSNKSVRFALDPNFSKGLTSTPFIDKESQVEEEEESEEDSDDESSESNEEDASSSEDSSDSSDEENGEAKGSDDDTSSSESESESSSDSSSDDDESPEEKSSKQESTATAPAPAIPKTTPPSQANKSEVQSGISPGQGRTRTHARNQRRRNANVLNRLIKKGILPAGTQLTEYKKLDVDETTPAETAFAALEEVKAGRTPNQTSEQTRPPLSHDPEFQRRRQQLLESVATGGVEVDSKFSRTASQSLPAESGHDAEMTGLEEPAGDALQSQQVIETQHTVELQDSVDLQCEFTDNVEQPTIAESQLVVASQEMADPAVVSFDGIEHPATTPNNGGTETETANSSIALEMADVDSPPASPQPPPASAESKQPMSSRRAKLDLGAGKRLLFGALGIKAPKTKKDEERVRSDLMKGVRPLVPKKIAEQPCSDPAAETAQEDPDAWRLKINYRAVECVQDDVALSEPPFPFEQRWDPQQQVSYKGDRGGKRKQDQRDQAQYYHENSRTSKKQKRRKGKHNYAEEQEYLDATYEPSYQDDSLASQYDDSAPNEQPQSDDLEGEITQQLMNETGGASQGPEDLLMLPEDPSTLPDLKDGQAQVGMTIAFKQLIMSDATNWQPQISTYQTAIVIALTDGGELQLNLAMRDRDQSNKRYDPQTGERLYSKFEVPDDNEMNEDDDDGMLYLTFDDLIEPKVVQEPPSIEDVASQAPGITNFDTFALSQDRETANEPEAQFSHVTETPLNSGVAEPNQLEESSSKAPAESQDIGAAIEPTTPSAESQLRESMIDAQAESITDDIPFVNNSVLRSNTPSAENQVEADIMDALAEGPVENIHPSTIPVLEPNTPSAEVQASHAIAIFNEAEHVSEEGRQKWSHLMKEGGFHSSVPSSLTKLMRPEGMTSPDGLERLALDMDVSEASLNRLYSPKFTGLGSSPTRKPRESSNSPKQNICQESPQLPQSSWETVDVDEPASSPPRVMPQDDPSFHPLSAASEMRYTESEAETSVKSPPAPKAMQEWQARKQQKQQSRKSAALTSKAETSETSPVPGFGFGLDGADEMQPIASVKYPELSVGSSFTSQIADYGHQPEFNFEDSLDLRADTPKGPSSEFDESSHDLQLNMVSESARSATSDGATESKGADVVMSDNEIDEPVLLRRKSNNETNTLRTSPGILEDDPSSEDLILPTIEEMASSQKALKWEKVTPKKSSRKDVRHKKPMDALDDVLEDDETTPKASQKQRSLSGNRKVRNSEKPPSQPRPSQSQPQASQIVDLTMSSDIEPEPESEPEKSAWRPSKRYDDEDDDSYEDEVMPKTGWMPKEDSNALGENRRHTSIGLRPSSQASLNTQNRRKTSSR